MIDGDIGLSDAEAKIEIKNYEDELRSKSEIKEPNSINNENKIVENVTIIDPKDEKHNYDVDDGNIVRRTENEIVNNNSNNNNIIINNESNAINQSNSAKNDNIVNIPKTNDSNEVNNEANIILGKVPKSFKSNVSLKDEASEASNENLKSNFDDNHNRHNDSDSLMNSKKEKRKRIEDNLSHLRGLIVNYRNEELLDNYRNNFGYVEIDFRQDFMDEIQKLDSKTFNEFRDDLNYIDPLLDQNFGDSDISDETNETADGFDINDPLIDLDEPEEAHISRKYDTKYGGLYKSQGKAELRLKADIKTQNSDYKKAKRNSKIKNTELNNDEQFGEDKSSNNTNKNAISNNDEKRSKRKDKKSKNSSDLQKNELFHDKNNNNNNYYDHHVHIGNDENMNEEDSKYSYELLKSFDDSKHDIPIIHLSPKSEVKKDEDHKMS